MLIRCAVKKWFDLNFEANLDFAEKKNEDYAFIFKKLADLYSNAKITNKKDENFFSESLSNSIKDFGENHSSTAQRYFEYGVFLKDIGGKEEIGITMIYKAYQIARSIFGESDNFVKLAFHHLCGKRKIMNKRKKLASMHF